MKRILIIDDEEVVGEVIKMILDDMGFSADATADARTGARLAGEDDYGLILVDVRMPVPGDLSRAVRSQQDPHFGPLPAGQE